MPLDLFQNRLLGAHPVLGFFFAHYQDPRRAVRRVAEFFEFQRFRRISLKEIDAVFLTQLHNHIVRRGQLPGPQWSDFQPAAPDVIEHPASGSW